MKKILVLSALAGAVSLNAQAQFQVENSDFEAEFIKRTYEKKYSASVHGVEPPNWSSFLTAEGDLKSFGVSKSQVFSVTAPDSLPNNGSGSLQCVKITDNEVKIGGKSIFAQGNLTTGCINMGASDPNNAAKNYNFTHLAASDKDNPTDFDYQRQPFTGHPDAMKVWVYYHSSNPAHRAKANTILHVDGRYQDPATTASSVQVVGKAETKEITPNDQWTELIIPFDYKSPEYAGKGSAYALVSFSTNAIPGTGTGESFMMIDDLSYVYNSELKKVTFSGQDIAVPAPNGTTQCTDLIYDEKLLSLESNGHAATIKKNYNSDAALLTVIVEGENVKDDRKNRHVYYFQFKKITGTLSSLTVGNQALPLVDNQMAYKYKGEYTKGCVTAATKEDVVTYTESYDPQTRICTIETNYTNDPSKNKTYTVKFYKEASSLKSKLIIAGDIEPTIPEVVVSYMQAPVQPVEITSPAGSKLDLHLMDFVFGELPVGDIFVNDVTCTDNGDGTYTIEKEDPSFKIYGDAAVGINSDITHLSLKGTLSTKGQQRELAVRIQITWAGKPIIVNVVPLHTTSISLDNGQAKKVNVEEVKKGLTNPNVLLYTDADTLGFAENVVVNGSCTNLIIKEGHEFNAPKAFTAKKVDFARSFSTDKDYVSSFVLPFSMDAALIQGKVYKFTGVNGDRVLFSEEKGMLTANTPYLIVASALQPFASLADVQVAATPLKMEVSPIQGYTHIGAYSTRKVSSDNITSYFGYKGGHFVKASTATLLPFRTMIEASTPNAPAQFSLKLGDEVTGIIGVNGELKEVDVYSLEGTLLRKNVNPATALQGLPKGAYIVNGKKVIK